MLMLIIPQKARFREIFTCSYDRYRSIYAGGGCWECERMDLGPFAPFNHHQCSVYGPIPITGAGKNYLGSRMDALRSDNTL